MGENIAAIWERTWDDPIAFYTFVLSIFTAWLAIVTIGLTIVGAWQGYNIRQAVLNDEESRRTLQRTYVSGGGTVRLWNAISDQYAQSRGNRRSSSLDLVWI